MLRFHPTFLQSCIPCKLCLFVATFLSLLMLFFIEQSSFLHGRRCFQSDHVHCLALTPYTTEHSTLRGSKQSSPLISTNKSSGYNKILYFWSASPWAIVLSYAWDALPVLPTGGVGSCLHHDSFDFSKTVVSCRHLGCNDIMYWSVCIHLGCHSQGCCRTDRRRDRILRLPRLCLSYCRVPR